MRLIVHSPFAFRGLVRRGIIPKIKILYSDPTMNRNIKIIHYLEEVFKPYHMMFKEKRGGVGGGATLYNVSARRIKRH
jgi:hypothetical protein